MNLAGFRWDLPSFVRETGVRYGEAVLSHYLAYLADG